MQLRQAGPRLASETFSVVRQACDRDRDTHGAHLSHASTDDGDDPDLSDPHRLRAGRLIRRGAIGRVVPCCPPSHPFGCGSVTTGASLEGYPVPPRRSAPCPSCPSPPTARRSAPPPRRRP